MTINSYINTNLWHNILNGLIIAGGFTTTLLLIYGCRETGTVLVCSESSFIPASWATPISAVTGFFGAIKLSANTLRDGFKGLGQVQPPVESASPPKRKPGRPKKKV